jgi:hypothetical protein
MRRAPLTLLLLAALLAPSLPARARADTESCLAAYDAVQRRRSSGKLRESEAQGLECAKESCPAQLRKDCLVWLDEIRRAIPSIVLSVTDASGCDLVERRVYVDDVLVPGGLVGKALDLDPGVHVVRVEAENHPPTLQRVALSEGEKDRRIAVSFAPPGIVCGGPKPPGVSGVSPDGRMEKKSEAPRQAEGGEPPSRPVPTFAYVFGAAAIVGLGASAGFYASGFSQKSTLDDCRPRCAASDVDTMRRTFFLGDALFGVGLVSLGLATYFYFQR